MTSASDLPDIQKTQDGRGIEIDQVGVSNIRFPLRLPLQHGGDFHTIAQVAMTVNLAHTEKGTHMSRFLEVLNSFHSEFAPNVAQEALGRIKDLLRSDSAYLKLSFPLFLDRKAPVTEKVGLIDFDCTFEAVLNGAGYDKIVGVEVMAASLCPCSKEISDYGAHNQRSRIKIEVRPTNSIMWFEELVKVAEGSASCQLYPVLKRPDEKFVTEKAYENPRFVEDIVRNCAETLRQWIDGNIISWFSVSSTNHESIHNHNAYAKIEQGDRGNLLKVW